MMGTNVGTEIEMYTVKRKDQYIVYTMANDQWQKKRWMILRQIWRGELSDLTGSMEDTKNLLRCPKKRRSKRQNVLR